jgi:hypothetical protein
VTGVSTTFNDGTLAVGDRIYNSSGNSYLGIITGIASNTSMTLNARDAVAASNVGFNGTTATITGSSNDFKTGLNVGDMLISNNTTLGRIASIDPVNPYLTLEGKAGTAVSLQAFKSTAGSMTFSTFYSSTSVFINTWYDQSGNGRDAMQPVAGNQPRIVNGGTLNTINGKPALEFSNTLSGFLQTSGTASWLTNTLYTQNIVSAEITPITNYQFLLSTTGGNGPNNTIMHCGYRGSSQYTVAQYGNDQNFELFATNSLELHTAVKNTISSSQFYSNGASLGTITSGAGSHLKDLGLMNIGLYTPTTTYYKGSISELTVYALAMTTERAIMDANQLAYYGIGTANWTGTTDNNWFETTNWSNGTVPNESSPSLVVIPNVTNKPVINSALIAKAVNILIQSSSSLTINGTLQLYGTLTSTGSNCLASGGTIEYMANAPQTILSGTFNGNTIKKIIINTTNSAVVSMGGSGALTISENITFATNRLAIGSTTLTLGGTATNTFSGGLRGSSNSSLIITGSPSLSFDQTSPGNNNLLRNFTMNGSGQVATLDNDLVLNSNGSLTFSAGKLAINGKTLTIRGPITNTASGGLRGIAGSSNLIVEGTVNRTISFDQTTPGTTNVLNNLTISTTSANTTSVVGDIVINGTLTTSASQILNLGTATLSGTLTTIINNGTITTQNTASAPVPSGKTWGGTVQYNGSAAQTAMAGIYNNLTISTTGGATASGNLTVNSVLNLSGANASTTKGCLEMTKSYVNYPGTLSTQYLDSYRLNMGAAATTIGTGDVTGTVKRTTILANTAYTFGHQYTTIALTEGTMPDSLLVSITIGNTPPGVRTSDTIRDAIKRTYEIVPKVQPGYSSGSRVAANFHYLDTELTSSITSYVNTEAKMVTWDYDIGGGIPADEHGRANYDFANNFIGLSNVPISYFIIIPTTHEWRTIFTLRDYLVSHKRWNGSVSSSWFEENNWTPVGQVGEGSHVIIPDVAIDPVLPSGGVTINTMTIETGGALTMGNNTLTIQNSFSGGWEDQNPAGNDPGTSTVIFTRSGTTISGHSRFYDVEIATDANVTNQAGSTLEIANTFTKTGTGQWYADIYDNTVVFSKSGAQTITTPDGTGYYRNLTLSGSGIKSLPGTALTINGSLSISGSASTTASYPLTIHGNLTLGSGTSFTAGSLSHNLGGNFVNNGATTFNSTGSTFTFNGSVAQSIEGSSPTTFNNITCDNTTGVTLSNTELTTVSGTLLINSGKTFKISPATHLTVSGTLTNNSGGADGIVLYSDASGTASMIANNSLLGTVQRYIAGTLNWHFLSSPVAAQPIWPEFAPTPTNDPLTFGPAPWGWDFYYWNPNANTTSQLYWVNLREDDVGTYNSQVKEAIGSSAGFGLAIPQFDVGRGYLVAYGSGYTGSTTHNYSGNLNYGSQSVPIIKSDGSFNNPWNLVGNPFPSAIDWEASSGWEKSVLANNGADYWIYNDADRNYGIYSTTIHSGTHGTSRNIAPMQGFFVEASSTGNLYMTKDVQVHAAQTWLKEDNDLANLLRFQLTTSANTFSDEMMVAVNPTFETGGSLKFWSMDNEAPEMFSIRGGKNYSIERLSAIDENSIVVIGVKAGVSANYTLTAKGLDNFSVASSVILEDQKNGKNQDLKNMPTYNFSANSGDAPERFHLHFVGPFGVDNSKENNDFTIFSFNNSVYIKNKSTGTLNGDVYIFNILGQKIVQQRLLDSMSKIDLNVPAGCYIVNLVTNNNAYCTKVFIR